MSKNSRTQLIGGIAKIWQKKHQKYQALLGKSILISFTACTIVAISPCVSCNQGNETITGSQNTAKESDRRVATKNTVTTDENGSTDGESQDSGQNSGTTGTKKTPKGSNKSQPAAIPAPATNDDTKKDSSQAATVTDFTSWCKLSSLTKPMLVDRMASLHSEFCDGANPKPLLTSTLIAQAYVGVGEPNFYPINNLTSDAATRTTSYRFGVALKIPTTAKDHFDRVGPKNGDVTQVKATDEVNGGTATVTLLNTFTNDEANQVRGWMINEVIVKSLLGGLQTLTVDSDTRYDQFMFKEGSLYMFSQYTANAKKSIKYSDILTASVQVDSNAYLIAIISLAIDNQGFSSVAEDEIRKTAIAAVKRMYEIAK